VEQESTAELLMGVARALRGSFVRALAGYDVTPGQARALRVALQDDPVRLSVLAERLHIAPRSATEVVDALEARGLVERLPDPADRRAVGVRPTAEGRRLSTLLGEARREASDDYLAPLEPADRNELERILRQLRDAHLPD